MVVFMSMIAIGPTGIASARPAAKPIEKSWISESTLKNYHYAICNDIVTKRKIRKSM
jgi:hypothetical protein